MAYKALYRQFRPRTFSELKGQELVSRVLKNQVINDEPAHAYIFSGPRGTGKTSTAKIFAAALNCTDRKDGEPCLKCENCRDALNDSMMDIIEMDAASNNGVDNARDIRDKVSLLPAKGKYKIYIIDEAHMLTTAAFNSLLKTLEEPPEHVVFILATTDLDAVPKTVLSRCLRLDFKYIDNTQVIDRLKQVVTSTGNTITDDALMEISYASEGAMRDALTILEKCCAYSKSIDSDIVSMVLGRADRNIIAKWLEAFALRNERDSLIVARQILDNGVEVNVFLIQIIEILNEVLLSKVTGENNSWSEYKDRFEKEFLINALDIFNETQSRLRYVAKNEILLETAVLKALSGRSINTGAASDSSLEQRLDALETKINRISAGQARPAENNVRRAPFTAAPSAAVKAPEPARKVQTAAPSEVPEGSVLNVILKVLEEEVSLRPFLNSISVAEEDDSRIKLAGVSELLKISIGEKKTDLEQRMKAEVGGAKRIEFAEREPQREKRQNIEIEIID